MYDLERLDIVLDLARRLARPLGHRDAHVLYPALERVPDHFADEGEYSGAVARYFAEEAWYAGDHFLGG